MVKRLNAHKVINQLTKITFFINVTKFFRKKSRNIPYYIGVLLLFFYFCHEFKWSNRQS